MRLPLPLVPKPRLPSAVPVPVLLLVGSASSRSSFIGRTTHTATTAAPAMVQTPEADPTNSTTTAAVASEGDAKQQPFPLPAPPGHDEGVDGKATTLDVSGEGTTAKLDHLGPLVVHRDGTLSRIANWADMTDIERRNTLRVLGKRNQLRLADLRGEDSPDKPLAS